MKTLAALPILPSSNPEFSESESGGEDQWNVRGVWRRKDDTGYLAVQDEEIEVEFTNYNQWISTTLRRFNAQHTVDLFDFKLISVYSGEYSRSHFAHEETGLEVSIKREPDEEVEFSAFVTHIEEPWEKHREYASCSQLRLAQKIKHERDEYL